MRVLIDACVLYPTVLRQIVMGVAEAGFFEPLWSARILDEWVHAAAREGQEDVAKGEIAVLSAKWTSAMVLVSKDTEARLRLPDPNDEHVLAAAIDGEANALMTLNLKDFPTRVLSAEGLVRRDPDGVVLEALDADAGAVVAVAERVLAAAKDAGVEGTPRSILKRASLPRVGKRLYS